MPQTPIANTLFYGDNLDVLRNEIGDESVDLVYLDPPFNSNATYNVIFSSPAGEKSQAQVQAFKDSWNWHLDGAERAYGDILKSSYSDAAELIVALRKVLGESDLMAYLTMMGVRLVELHRVLKPAGSLYLHCDPTASHYLKILMDAFFGRYKFGNEIIWQRTNAKSHAFTRFSSGHDVIFRFCKSENETWNSQYLSHTETYIKSHYANIEEATGRRYTLGDCLNPNPNRPNLTYEWRGLTGVRRWTREKMQQYHDEGRIIYTKTGMPRYKRYLDEMPGTPLTDVWSDIFPINSQAQERLGYPTQKPVALLERIVAASSNEGDLVLDPFCGCGTTVHAAQKLNRRWIGIDITHLAIRLIDRRMRKAFPGINFDILGVPKDLDGAQALADADKHQFQLWALSLVEAQPFKGGVKGADGGVDGIVWFHPDKKVTEKAIVSVKGGKHVSDTHVKDLITTVEHTGAKMGVFVTLAPPTKPMMVRAASAGFYKTEFGEFPKVQILTVQELLEGKQPFMPWRDESAFRKPKREETGKQGAFDV